MDLTPVVHAGASDTCKNNLSMKIGRYISDGLQIGMLNWLWSALKKNRKLCLMSKAEGSLG